MATLLGGDILWENASPRSSFASQTITLNLEAYKRVEIRARCSSSASAEELTVGVCPIGKKIQLIGVSTSTYHREFTLTQNGVIISDGKYGNNPANDTMIPYQIIGYKY